MDKSEKAMRPLKEVAIIGYGAYVPRYRIKNEEIARIWQNTPIFEKNNKYPVPIIEKAVAARDEDSVTMSIEAARRALKRAGINPKELRAILMGSESNPYAVKTAGVTIAAAIGGPKDILAATYEFACKAGTEAMQTSIGLVGSGMAKYAMAIGADTAQGKPGDALEYTAASGAVAYIFGEYVKGKSIAKVEATYSYAKDVPDFWRRELSPYPEHGQRFTGEPAYFDLILGAAKGIMESLGYTPNDFDYAIFHQPNYKFPLKVAKILGFRDEQVKQGVLSRIIGNTYSGSSIMGLAATLDVAKPGDKILLVSYGSGSGSDAMVFEVDEGILEKRSKAPLVNEIISNGVKYIDYAIYARFRKKIMK
ncbi:MAG: hydroxymethylglutaryl-CoA synthase [Candidatus Njordarchaeia archaeon]